MALHQQRDVFGVSTVVASSLYDKVDADPVNHPQGQVAWSGSTAEVAKQGSVRVLGDKYRSIGWSFYEV